MFSFLAQFVPKRRERVVADEEPDFTESSFAPTFVPPAALVRPGPSEDDVAAAEREAEEAEARAAAEREAERLAAEAAMLEEQRLAEERLAERTERTRLMLEERDAEERRRAERRAQAERDENERLERERTAAAIRAEQEARAAEEARGVDVATATSVVEDAEPAPPMHVVSSALRFTWPATLLQHDEAAQYGEAARRNLISTVVDLHDEKLAQILGDALYEESGDGLRPDVLEALRRCYHGEALRTTYERFVRIGSAREREIAREGLATLGGDAEG